MSPVLAFSEDLRKIIFMVGIPLILWFEHGVIIGHFELLCKCSYQSKCPMCPSHKPDTDSAITEITNIEAAGGITRGQGNDIVKTHHHGVSP